MALSWARIMSEPAAPERVTAWIEEARAGNRQAVDALLPLVYGELRRVAAIYLARERPGNTLNATALVHEAYLRLLHNKPISWQGRAHFRAIAAKAMRQILIERARARHAAKRGGAAVRLSLSAVDLAAPHDSPDEVDVVALHEALERLARIDTTRATLVELRYFGGLTIEETAEVLGQSPATVKRGWALARAWLHRELEGGGGRGAAARDDA